MNKTLSIETERVDDIPLLMSHMHSMKLMELLDKHFATHGGRKGLSLGEVSVVWLAHILSQADHRMNRVQQWTTKRLETLRRSGMSKLETQDMTDDRLADVLRILSDDEKWQLFEQELMAQLVRVYDLQAQCVRIDTTTASSYADVNKEGLLQLGHSKDHRPDLPQLKVVLASLDPMGMPLATEIISGENADDPVYLPIMARVRNGLQKKGLLYVGDCKMAALQTRAQLQTQGDFYLCPLSAVQMPADRLQHLVQEQRKQGKPVVQVMRVEEDGKSRCLAQGYETMVPLSAEVDGHQVGWQERQLLVQSLAAVHTAQINLQERLQKAQHALQDVAVRKQGKPRLKDRFAVEEATKHILTRFRVNGLLCVHINEQVQEHSLRAYGGRLPTTRQEGVFTVTSDRDEQAIAQAEDQLGWRIYSTNHPLEQLTLEQAVEAYRDEYRVERNFARLKGRPLSLAPLYVQRDDHRVGLVRLLSIALRVMTLLEGVLWRRLSEQKMELSGLFAGNPKRRTSQPTTELLLENFREITLTLVSLPGLTQRHITPLSALQQHILTLLGMPPAVYFRLADDSLNSP